MKNNLSIETICAVFCKFNHISPIDLYSTTRSRPIAETRRMIWGYLRENTRMTWKALGELFGRDHATAMYGAGKHKIHISVSPKGSCYDIMYANRYKAALREIDGEDFLDIADLTDDDAFTAVKDEINIVDGKSYMLTYYCPTTDKYIAPVVKANSLRRAIQEYELYNPITDEELILAKYLKEIVFTKTL